MKRHDKLLGLNTPGHCCPGRMKAMKAGFRMLRERDHSEAGRGWEWELTHDPEK